VLEEIFVARNGMGMLKDTAWWGKLQSVLITYCWKRSCQRRCNLYNNYNSRDITKIHRKLCLECWKGQYQFQEKSRWGSQY